MFKINDEIVFNTCLIIAVWIFIISAIVENDSRWIIGLLLPVVSLGCFAGIRFLLRKMKGEISYKSELVAENRLANIVLLISLATGVLVLIFRHYK